jgi:hypothetical protein
MAFGREHKLFFSKSKRTLFSYQKNYHYNYDRIFSGRPTLVTSGDHFGFSIISRAHRYAH